MIVTTVYLGWLFLLTLAGICVVLLLDKRTRKEVMTSPNKRFNTLIFVVALVLGLVLATGFIDEIYKWFE